MLYYGTADGTVWSEACVHVRDICERWESLIVQVSHSLLFLQFNVSCTVAPHLYLYLCIYVSMYDSAA
jgi:hypothetical protein